MSGDPRYDEPGPVDTVTIGVPTGEIDLPATGAPEADLDEIVVEAEAEAESRPPGPALGIAALSAAVLVVIGTTVGVVLATSDAYLAATQVAWAAIGVSGLAVVLGTLAIALRRGRAWGLTAVVLAIVANPFLLRSILALVGGPTAA